MGDWHWETLDLCGPAVGSTTLLGYYGRSTLDDIIGASCQTSLLKIFETRHNLHVQSRISTWMYLSFVILWGDKPLQLQGLFWKQSASLKFRKKMTSSYISSVFPRKNVHITWQCCRKVPPGRFRTSAKWISPVEPVLVHGDFVWSSTNMNIKMDINKQTQQVSSFFWFWVVVFIFQVIASVAYSWIKYARL